MATREKEEQEEIISIYEASDHDERLVCPYSQKEMVRPGKFLKPRALNVDQSMKVPGMPLLSEIFSDERSSLTWSSKITFRSWHGPQKDWSRWVKCLEAKYESTWKKCNIHGALLSSTYKIDCNRNLVFGLAQFWCSETNTFVFPWGEATVTLEDVLIIGGFPVTGLPITSPLRGDKMLEKKTSMEKNRKAMQKRRLRIASYTAWLNNYMEMDEKEGEGGELEHAAFLSLWLSRFVFPSRSYGVINKETFPLAIHLSRGEKMALGPAVLASIYRNLCELKQRILNSLNSTCGDSITVSGPMQLLQIWAFERFELLRPQSPSMLKLGQPRIARWHHLIAKTSLSIPLVMYVVKSAENFTWRPYADDLPNSHDFSCFKHAGEVVLDNSNSDEVLHSFVKCLLVSELVGLSGREKYTPHRVAMQFGMDQDLPGEFSSINFANKKIKLIIPPKFPEPGVTVRYLNWWRQMKLSREDEIKAKLRQQMSYGCIKWSTPPESRFTMTRKKPSDLAAIPGEDDNDSSTEGERYVEVSLLVGAGKTGRENCAMVSQEDVTSRGGERCNDLQTGSSSKFKTSTSGDFSDQYEDLHGNATGGGSIPEDHTHKQFRSVAAVDLADCVKFNCRKRKRSAPAGTCSSEVSEPVKEKDDVADKSIGKDKEVKKESDDLENQLEDDKSKVLRSLSKFDAKNIEKGAAGGSVDNPIDLDEYEGTSANKVQNLSVEERLQRLESLTFKLE